MSRGSALTAVGWSNWLLRVKLGTAPPFVVFMRDAGVSAFEASRILEQRADMDVNLRAPRLLKNALIGGQRFADNGTAVFISSLSHFVGDPGAAASKDGLHANVLRRRALFDRLQR